MRYLSLFSGIEAASVAWHSLGWIPVAFAEIDKFASAILAHHYPDVPNLGDVTKVDWHEFARANGPLDLVVFGSPCQSFSVAGKRLGLDDHRGNLALIALGIVNVIRPKWFVFENVPGLLSSGDGRDFGAFLGTVEELGYGWAYAILDAQYCRTPDHPRAVPQRRRRVFVVGYLGDWRRAAAVLFERESLSGHPPPRREAGKGVAAGLRASASPRGHGNSSGLRGDGQDNLVPEIANPLTHRMHKGVNTTMDEGQTMIAHSLRAMGHDRSHAKAGGQVAVAFDMRGREGGSQFEGPHETANIRAASGGSSKSYIAQAFTEQSFREDGSVPTLVSGEKGGGKNAINLPHIAERYAVRRLTPLECERLQGFPDGYTAITYRGKPAAGGNRYKALGNSMACNVMAWLLGRIAEAHSSNPHAIRSEGANMMNTSEIHVPDEVVEKAWTAYCKSYHTPSETWKDSMPAAIRAALQAYVDMGRGKIAAGVIFENGRWSANTWPASDDEMPVLILRLDSNDTV